MELTPESNSIAKNEGFKKFRRSLQNNNVRSYGNEILSELHPLKSAMILQLQKRGYNTRLLKLKDIVPLYYNEFVSKKEPLDIQKFKSHTAFKISPSDNLNGDIESSRNKLMLSELSSIVDEIVNFFNGSKAKKQYLLDQGINPKYVMTEEEILQANTAKKIENDLETSLLLNEPVKKKTFTNFIFFCLFIYVLYTLLK